MKPSPPIIYTWTDEAPALATYAFLPVIRAFAGAAGVPIETRDISLAGRILAAFPEAWKPDEPVVDGLAELFTLNLWSIRTTQFHCLAHHCQALVEIDSLVDP